MSIRKGRAHPAFADDGTEMEMARARDLFESQLGSRRGDVDEQEFRRCFSNPKTAEIGLSVLTRYYSFRSHELNEVLEDSVLQSLSRAGINDCMELRLRLYEFLTERYSGFMSTEERGRALAEFAARLGLDAVSLEQALWLDEGDSRALVRLSDAPPDSLKGAYNLEVLSAILCNSQAATLGPIGQGLPAKFAFRALRLYGLFYRLVKAEGGLVFEVDGPLGLFGRASKFGYRHTLLVYRLRQLALRRDFDCNLSILFRKSKRALEYACRISDLPDLSWPNVGDLKLQLFDSKVEAKVFSTFRAVDLGGWRVEREPSPVVCEGTGTVFIPDFKLTRGNSEVLVEVIGFWLPEYRRKKKAKLEELRKAGIENLLLLVDEKLEEDFAKLTDYPVMPYSRAGTSYRIPYARILGFLEERYPAPKGAGPQVASPQTTKYVERRGGRYRVFW